MATLRKDGQPKKTAAKKGEPDYFERNTEAARQAAKEAGTFTTRKYADAETLQKKIDGYFNRVEEDGGIPTEHGLAGYLGVTRETLAAWRDGKKCDDLRETVQMAYDRIADEVQQLIAGGNKAAVGYANFLLKQGGYGGYSDKQSMESTVKIIGPGAEMFK